MMLPSSVEVIINTYSSGWSLIIIGRDVAKEWWATSLSTCYHHEPSSSIVGVEMSPLINAYYHIMSNNNNNTDQDCCSSSANPIKQ